MKHFTPASPLLARPAPADLVFFKPASGTTRQTLLKNASDVASAIIQSKASHVINLCEDRELFAQALLGAVMAKRGTLLPQNHNPRTIERLQTRWPDAVLIDDAFVLAIPRAPLITPSTEECDSHFEAITLFTSGSTGAPHPHRKRWGDLMTGTARLAARLESMCGIHQGAHIVATVPPQHMFGLETSILLPLHAGMSVFRGRPFYPADVASALHASAAPRILVTSPLHLRALVEAGIEWPEINLVLSATDTLSPELALQAEQQLGAPVLEIYGSTETGAIATRRTIATSTWHLLDGVALHEQEGTIRVEADHIPGVALNDHVHLEDEGHFTLLGRKSDLINVAGKRGSLGDLNHRLRHIPGVLDGAIFMPESGQRLAGLVIAPELSTREILTELSKDVDPVFLPRPLYKVESLPRTSTGKLARQDLLGLLEKMRGGA